LPAAAGSGVSRPIAYGVANALMLSAVVMLLGIVIGLKFRCRPSQSLNLDPLNRFTEPSLSLDITPRSGPIVIQVDYEIDDDDVPEFLTLMGERRRIRIRDGASNWALMRDLEKPGSWTETYHTPTWVEYIRHNQRRTQADARIPIGCGPAPGRDCAACAPDDRAAGHSAE
jgi:hypothetical protein